MPETMEQAWDRWQDELAKELATLGRTETEFINTTAPAITRERKPGLFGRRRAPEVISAPLVLFLGMEEGIVVESVNPFPTGPERPLTDEQWRQLGEAGWAMPDDPDYVPQRPPVLAKDFDPTEAAGAADLARRTYQILGVDDPATVDFERDS